MKSFRILTCLGTKSLLAALFLLTGGTAVAADRAGQEIQYPNEAFAKLDTFEALNLQDADKLFNKNDYKGAFAAYKAYSFEFAQSPALPYVLLRMGRCLHHLGKRNAAIKAYQDVVDYFPDDVRYAAAALFYIGQCHGQNGDDAKKTAVWARMVKDDGYVAQPNSGTALTYLAKRMQEIDKHEEAAEYHWRTAVAFRASNERAAADARREVLYHYACRNPNHDKLKSFYVEAKGFDGRGRDTDSPQGDPRYWEEVMDTVLGMRGENEKQETACRYWARAFGDLFPQNDKLRIRLFNLQRVYEKDNEAWTARMNKQFSRQPATLQRVAAWIPYFNWNHGLELEFASKHGGPLIAGAAPKDYMQILERMRGKRDKFYAEHVQPTVAKLEREEKIWLMNRLRYPCGLHEQAQSVLRSVNTAGMSDEQLRDLGMFAAHYLSEEDVLRYFAKMKDNVFAAKCRFDYYNARTHRNRPFQEKALAEIPVLKKAPKYAGQELVLTEANLLRGLGRYEEAIKSYQAANKQPHSTYGVADCLVALKQYGEAIKTVRGLESVGGATAARACLKIADIYRVAGNKGKEVDQLRLVLRRYPKSGESSEAHQRLENYGVKVTGGEAEAEE